jgi:hypothetical protein
MVEPISTAERRMAAARVGAIKVRQVAVGVNKTNAGQQTGHCCMTAR